MEGITLGIVAVGTGGKCKQAVFGAEGQILFERSCVLLNLCRKCSKLFPALEVCLEVIIVIPGENI